VFVLVYFFIGRYPQSGPPQVLYWGRQRPNQGKLTERGRVRTVDLLVLTSLDQLIYIIKILFTFFKTSYLGEEVNCTEPRPFSWCLWPNSQILDSRKGYFTRPISEADFALGLCVCFQHIDFFFHEKAPANAKSDSRVNKP
jgi:hypothetical protein